MMINTRLPDRLMHDVLFLCDQAGRSNNSYHVFMMRQIFIFILFLPSVYSFAQTPSAQGPGNGRPMNVGHFYGKVVDEKSGKGIEFATIQLFQNKPDSTSKQTKRTLVTGALTESNGDFSLENVPVMGTMILRVTAIGYDSVQQQVSFDLKGKKYAAGDGCSR
jgi:hypothetical protein